MPRFYDLADGRQDYILEWQSWGGHLYATTRGFVADRKDNLVYKLQKSIYGLKQASKSWNVSFDQVFKSFGFTQNSDEPCVYKKSQGKVVAFLVLYVDDILLIGNDVSML